MTVRRSIAEICSCAKENFTHVKYPVPFGQLEVTNYISDLKEADDFSEALKLIFMALKGAFHCKWNTHEMKRV